MIHVTIMRSNGETEEALAPQPDEHKKALAAYDGLTADKALAKAPKNATNSSIRRLEVALSELAARVERRQRRPDHVLAGHDLGSLTIKVEEG